MPPCSAGWRVVTWEQAASEHIGHKAVLRDVRTLECVQCQRKLILPRDPGGATPVPSAFHRPDRPGVPMPPNFRERVWADLKHRREQRAEKYPEATP